VSTFHPAPKRALYFRVETTGTALTADERGVREAAFAKAAEAFSRVLILVATLLGAAAIFAGAVVGIHFIGAGLIIGGVEAR